MNFGKIFNLRKNKKQATGPAIPITPYDVAHDLYCQMIQRPVTEHDEIVYTFLRLHCPKKHIHSNPVKRKQAVNDAAKEKAVNEERGG